MATSGALLIDYECSLDYCQPSLPGHEITVQVLDSVHNEGIQLDMTKNCWKNLTNSLTNTIELFNYLGDEATGLLRKHDCETALGIFKDQVLTNSNLREAQDISLNEKYMPEISDLQDAVEDMGLMKFRAYADTQVTTCQNGQTNLDFMISERYERGGANPWVYESAINKKFDRDRVINLLIDAYIWGDSTNDYLLARQNSPIYLEKEFIRKSMETSHFDILSPTDIVSYLD